MFNKTFWLGCLLALGVSGVSVAQAQDSDSFNNPTSPQEMESFVRSSLEEMVNGVKSMGKMVEQARRDEDEEKLTCLRSRLSYVRALLIVSECAMGSS